MGGYSGYNLNGKVADIKIYNTVLSASDIKRLYEVQTAITNTNNLLTTEVVETDFGNLHNILPFRHMKIELLVVSIILLVGAETQDK